MSKKFVLAELDENHELIKRIVKILEKGTRQKTVYVFADKMTKKAGVATKRVNITFEEGQELGLVFRTDGDVIQLFINKKNTPIRNAIDYDNEKGFNDAIEDLALKIKAGQEKFNVQRRNAKVVIPRTKAPSLTVRKRIQMARDALSEIDDALKLRREDLNKRIESINTLKATAAVGTA